MFDFHLIKSAIISAMWKFLLSRSIGIVFGLTIICIISSWLTKPTKATLVNGLLVNDAKTLNGSPTEDSLVMKRFLEVADSPQTSKTLSEIKMQNKLFELREKIIVQKNRISLALRNSVNGIYKSYIEKVNKRRNESSPDRKLSRSRRDSDSHFENVKNFDYEKQESTFSLRQLKSDHFSKLKFRSKEPLKDSVIDAFCKELKSGGSGNITGRVSEKSLHCYQCKSTLSDEEPQCDNYLWKHLRHSEKFQLRRKCPNSEDAYCAKRISKKFGERITERGCFMDPHLQVYNDKLNISEGCITYRDDGYLTVICFCKNELCNQSSRLKNPSVLAIALILLYNFLLSFFMN